MRVLACVSLAILGVGAQGPGPTPLPPLPPLPPVTEQGNCAPYAADPCNFQCGVPGDFHRFEMSSLTQQAGAAGYLHAVGDQGHSYYFGACNAVQGVRCGSSTGGELASAIQAWGGNPPNIPSGSCAVLGMASPRNCSITPVGAGGSHGMLCKYIGGSEQRTVSVEYICDPTVPLPHLRASQPGTALVYSIQITGADMCGAVYIPPLSWGTDTLIFFIVVSLVYVGAGAAINVKVRERRMTVEDAFPQYMYWKELPGLVKDGCAFTWEVTLKMYYKYSGAAPPHDPSLSRRLADDDGGDADNKT